MIYQILKKQVSKAINTFNFDKNLTKLLENPKKTISTTMILDKNNNIHIINGYRVQHNNIMGPYKSGITFNKKVDMDECSALAGWMTYKNALQNLPLVGGKGGVVVTMNIYKIR